MYHGSDEDDGIFWCCKTQESFGPDGQPPPKPIVARDAPVM